MRSTRRYSQPLALPHIEIGKPVVFYQRSRPGAVEDTALRRWLQLLRTRPFIQMGRCLGLPSFPYERVAQSHSRRECPLFISEPMG